MKTIKKINLLAIAASVAFITSCGNDKTKETAEAVATTDTVYVPNDSMEKVYQRDLDEINSNLALIGEKQGVLDGPTGEKNIKKLPKKEDILRNIDMINSLFERNKNIMDDLKKKVSASRSASKKIKEQLKEAQEQLAQKEMEIVALKEQLTLKHFEADELNQKMSGLQLENELLREKGNKMDVELHKVYFTEGTYKELRAKNVLKKEGGVLGISRVAKLSEGANKKDFTEFDTREIKSIPIHGKKAKIITPHPVDSYELKEEDKKTAILNIKDPEKFWGESKYLVVEIKGR